MTDDVAPRREYPNPPISEVICQATFAEPVPWSAATPGLLYGEIRDEYPAEPKSQTSIEATLDRADGEVQIARGVQRFVYSNDQQNRRLVANETSVSVNALVPYEQWDSLSQRFRAALDAYQHTIASFTPKVVNLRYINKIKVPAESFELSKYFSIPVVTSHQPGVGLRGFVSRSQSFSPETSIGTTITFANVVGHPVEGESAFILDIDLETQASEDASFDELCELARQLHHWENHEFESSITNECRELFN